MHISISQAFVVISIFLSPFSETAATPSSISSPNKQIMLSTVMENGQLSYSVDYQGNPLISASRLGVILNKEDFAGKLTITSASISTHDEQWTAVWGQQSEHRDHYNQLTIELTEQAAAKRHYKVVLRAYDDGIAFRYVYPKQAGLSKASLKQEFSAVSLVSDAPVAWYPRNSTCLENNVPFDQIDKPCRTPFTARLAPSRYVSLHEAAVVNSSDANLAIGENDRTFTYQCVSKQAADSVSAWRTIQIADSPAGLIESTLILNLNPPCKLEDTSWIKPGVSLWDWRNHGGKTEDGFTYGINTASYLRYIDYAAAEGLAYVLIDAEWYGPERNRKSDPTTTAHTDHVDVDMPTITDYARKKGVGIWLYINDKALKGFDIDRTLTQYQKWGIKGIKHGFLGGGNQVKNAFSIHVLEKCAEYQIMYNLHEPNKPTGVERTYPHYVSREYVNSMLDAAVREPATPSELSIFPVVHNLGGPVDRSCGLFDMDNSITRDKVHKQIPSTVVSQVAQCLLFPSGILTLPDMPEAYQRKADLFEFIKNLPMTYDETKVLEMEIGSHTTMARRNGETWFVAAVADEAGRKTELALDFLKEGVSYEVTIYEDAADAHYQFPGGWNRQDASKKGVPFVPVETKRELYEVSKTKAKKGDVLQATLAPGGGYCLLIRPQASE